jgi:hypothetical protein
VDTFYSAGHVLPQLLQSLLRRLERLRGLCSRLPQLCLEVDRLSCQVFLALLEDVALLLEILDLVPELVIALDDLACQGVLRLQRLSAVLRLLQDFGGRALEVKVAEFRGVFVCLGQLRRKLVLLELPLSDQLPVQLRQLRRALLTLAGDYVP